MNRNYWYDLLLRACNHFSRSDRCFSKISNLLAKVMIEIYNHHFIRLREKKVSKLRKKGNAVVLFVCPDCHSFALSEVYRLMADAEILRPVIGVTYFDHIDPSIGTDIEKYEETIHYFKSRGYETVGFGRGKEEIGKKILEINPDIIFFNSTMALKSIAELEKLVSDKIKVKVSYGYYLSNLQQAQFNERDLIEFDYLFWEAPMTVQMSRKYAINRGINSYYLGYPKLDAIMYPEHVDDSCWKPCGGVKKIIWAPHHSIEDDENVYGLSCFLLIAESMLDLAKDRRFELQIAFKPHPLLKHRLYHCCEWGRERTDQYYEKWRNLDNGQLVLGDYDSLFVTSDAMIMDSISFMCEYAAVNKPCLFTIKDATVQHKFNELGTKAFNLMYQTSTDIKKDIERFVDDVVILKNDYKKEEREKFLQEELRTPNGQKASDNIVSFFEQLISN